MKDKALIFLFECAVFQNQAPVTNLRISSKKVSILLNCVTLFIVCGCYIMYRCPLPSKGTGIIIYNCFDARPHYPVSRPLIKINRAADIWTVPFAATAVRQLGVRGLADLPAPLQRLRLSLCRLLPRQGSLLRLGWTQLLTLLSKRQKVCKGVQFWVPTQDWCLSLWQFQPISLKKRLRDFNKHLLCKKYRMNVCDSPSHTEQPTISKTG